MKSLFSLAITVLIGSFVLSACGGQYNGIEGATFISGLGNPPVDYISWSPINQNEVLVTASVLGRGRAEVYILSLLTNKKQILAQTELGDISAETWLSDGKHVVVYVSPDTRGFEEPGYWIISTGGDSIEFFSNTDEPVWSPDGKKIALYTMDRKPDSDTIEIRLHIVDIRTNTDETIYSNTGDQRLYGFSWSPDGKYLVFSLGNNSSRDLYVIELETRALRQLTHRGKNDSPVWSPLGGIIAYHSTTSDGLISSLRLITPEGSCDIEIPKLNDVRSPTWLPDGKKLGFIGPDGIYTLDLNKVLVNNISQDKCLVIQQ